MKTLRAIVLGIGVVALSGSVVACGGGDKKEDTTPKKMEKTNPCKPGGEGMKKENPCKPGGEGMDKKEEPKTNPCKPSGEEGATKDSGGGR